MCTGNHSVKQRLGARYGRLCVPDCAIEPDRSFERALVSAVVAGWRWSGHGGSDAVHGPEELIGKRGAVCRLWSPQLCV